MPKMVVHIMIQLVVISCCIFTCTSGDYPFRNISLSWDERVDDLVGRLTLEEIVHQMAWSQTTAAIDRLGIKPYDWDTECLRGDVQASNGTSFPQSIGLAAAFSPRLIYRVAEATAVEVRAKHNNYTQHGYYGPATGISCFSPVINIMRHPLWGRNQETYGEDPFINGLYAQHFVAGLQGDHPRYVRASAGCKHFDAHGGPENIPVSRKSFDAKVTMRDWRMTFLPAFRMCVEAGSYSIMCSYNSINGIPSCANKELLTDILRVEWGFTGYIVSDQGAVEMILNGHHYTSSNVTTAAAAVNAGLSLDLAEDQQTDFFNSIGKAVSEGLLTEELVRQRVKPLFYTRMRLGEFDPPEMNPYTRLDISVIESESHRTLSREAAVQSIVLLKNRNGFLPLKFPNQFERVAIVGPMANNSIQIFGNFATDSDPKFTVTPYLGLQTIWPTIRLGNGCSSTRCTDYDSSVINKAVTGASLVFVSLGTGQLVESDGNDRATMDLPGYQLQLLQDAVRFANGAPVVLLLYNAGPLDITWADDNDGVAAILEGFFPAQEAGNAFLQVLLGEQSPAGRLPYTWYRDVNQTPEITNYTMSERTYRYFTGEPLYPFGYGLSYSVFTYTNLTIGRPRLQAGQDQVVFVTLHNSGHVVSDEVVEIYISWVNPSTPVPRLQLVAFDRLKSLSPGESAITVKFTILSHQMAQWDDSTNKFMVEPGEIMVYAGGQQPNQTKSVGSNVLQGSFNIVGTTFLGKF